MTTTNTIKITGHEAIAYAEHTGCQLHKHTDPTEGARDVSVNEARDIAKIDANLIYVLVPRTAEAFADLCASWAQAEGLTFDDERDIMEGWPDTLSDLRKHLGHEPSDEEWGAVVDALLG